MARVQEADAQLRIAGAPLLPSLDLGATATRERTSVPGQGMGVFNVFNPVLTASYELDFWGKNRAARDAARALAVASRYDRETVALTVISSVATTYFQALELRERIEVAQQNLENGENPARPRIPNSKSAPRPASMSRSRKRPWRCSTPRCRRWSSNSGRRFMRWRCWSARRRNRST